LLKQVANDFLSLWKGVFEQVLLLTDDIKQAKVHANADGNVTLNVKIDAPESYQQLIQWLTEQAEYAKSPRTTDDQKMRASPAQTTPIVSNFTAGIVGIILSLLGVGLFFHFWPTSFMAVLLIGFIWLFFKHPLYVLIIWLGFTMES
jgi:hypothetical protein